MDLEIVLARLKMNWEIGRSCLDNRFDNRFGFPGQDAGFMIRGLKYRIIIIIRIIIIYYY